MQQGSEGAGIWNHVCLIPKFVFIDLDHRHYFKKRWYPHPVFGLASQINVVQGSLRKKDWDKNGRGTRLYHYVLNGGWSEEPTQGFKIFTSLDLGLAFVNSALWPHILETYFGVSTVSFVL